jgi:hypothetical protein
MTKRQKRPLGDLFGLKSFGVNLTCLTAETRVILVLPQGRHNEAKSCAPNEKGRPESRPFFQLSVEDQ